MIHQSLSELIGNTPLLRLKRLEQAVGARAELVAKLEMFNPLSSVKDRVGYALITDAEAKGLLRPGATIIEPTSGNTGIGLAFVAVERGYKLILTMPETMSRERRMLLTALGAEIVLTPGAEGMRGAIAKAKSLLEEIPGAWTADQFNNPANPEAHVRTTAEEIWRDTEGKVDAFVAGVGTGGTITGVGRGLRAKSESIKIIAVEPEKSPVLEGGAAGPHGLQGIGAGFVPSILDRSLLDEIIGVADENAMAMCKRAAKTEGLLIGISGGAALCAAAALAKRMEYEGKRIVVLLPDTGERYLSTGLFGGES